MVPSNSSRAASLPPEALSIASDPSSPPHILDWLARFDYQRDEEYMERGEAILLEVAENPATPPEALTYLIEEALPPVWDGIREAAIRNPNCPPKLLTALTFCQGDYQEEQSRKVILMEVARHPSSPQEAIQRLCFHPLPVVRLQARNHPAADLAWLSEVEGIPDSFVMKMFDLGEWEE